MRNIISYKDISFNNINFNFSKKSDRGHMKAAENVYNSDQSGFELEIYSKRTLTEEEKKTIEFVV